VISGKLAEKGDRKFYIDFNGEWSDEVSPAENRLIEAGGVDHAEFRDK
jgi:hypothetical protein